MPLIPCPFHPGSTCTVPDNADVVSEHAIVRRSREEIERDYPSFELERAALILWSPPEPAGESGGGVATLAQPSRVELEDAWMTAIAESTATEGLIVKCSPCGETLIAALA